METNVSGAPRKGTFYEEDFEPFYRWQHETLQIRLDGFKMEQLKVQITPTRILVISGERPFDASRSSRFRKEIKLSDDANVNAIRAWFCQGILSIVIPKNVEPLEKESEKKSINNVAVEAPAAAEEKGSISGVKTIKRRVIKAAAVVVVVVGMVVVLGTQIARLDVHGRHMKLEVIQRCCECLV